MKTLVIGASGHAGSYLVKKLVARGHEVVALMRGNGQPYDGLSMIQHIHSADLANIILACMEKQEIANGQAFIAVAEKSMTLRAITENLYRHFGHTPNIRYLEWRAFAEAVGEQNTLVTLDHISHSPCCTPRKAQTLLGVEIKYSIMDIFYDYIAWQKQLRNL